MSRLMVAGILAVAALAACGSPDTTTQTCPPSAVAGKLQVRRSDLSSAGDSEHDYALSTSQVEDLVKNGSVTVSAGQDGAGAGSLDANDPVVALTMHPVPDAAGTYELQGANATFCPSASAKLVLSNGAVIGCSPSGDVLTAPIQASVVVASASSKRIEPGCHPGGCWSGVSVAGEYGSACP